MDYKDMTGPDGTEVNMGGTSQVAFFARVDDVLTWPGPATAQGANPYVNTTPFVMKQGKKFQKLYITQDTGELDFGSNGEQDGKSFKPVLKTFYPGASDDALQFINDAKNDKFVLIVELPDGKLIQLGSARFFITLSPTFKTVTTSGRGRGYELEWMGYTPYIYR